MRSNKTRLTSHQKRENLFPCFSSSREREEDQEKERMKTNSKARSETRYTDRDKIVVLEAVTHSADSRHPALTLIYVSGKRIPSSFFHEHESI